MSTADSQREPATGEAVGGDPVQSEGLSKRLRVPLDQTALLIRSDANSGITGIHDRVGTVG